MISSASLSSLCFFSFFSKSSLFIVIIITAERRGVITNYYEVLGVSQSADLDEIKSSYRQIQKKYHPDVYKGDNPDYAADMVKRANEAYSVLSDEGKRAEYDMQLRYGSPADQSYNTAYSNSQGSYGDSYRRTYYTYYTRYGAPGENGENNTEYENFDQQQYPFGFNYMTGRGCLRSLVVMGLIWLGLSLLGLRWIAFPLLFFFF